VIVTDDGVVATRARGRVDGAFHVPDVDGTFLLLRTTSGRDGFLDAVFRVYDGRLRRIHVRGGPYGDGLVTAYVVTTTIDIDCGAAAGTVVQVEQQSLGRIWRRTLLTYAFKNDVLRFTHARTSIVSGAQAGSRRCDVARRCGLRSAFSAPVAVPNRCRLWRQPLIAVSRSFRLRRRDSHPNFLIRSARRAALHVGSAHATRRVSSLPGRLSSSVGPPRGRVGGRGSVWCH
jgi:hypothetical protein